VFGCLAALAGVVLSRLTTGPDPSDKVFFVALRQTLVAARFAPTNFVEAVAVRAATFVKAKSV